MQNGFRYEEQSIKTSDSRYTRQFIEKLHLLYSCYVFYNAESKKCFHVHVLY